MAGLSDFWTRIRVLYRNLGQRVVRPTAPPQRTVGPRSTTAPQAPEVPAIPPAGPLDMATTLDNIHAAGRRLLQLDITYNGTQRLVEPYSMRLKSTGQLFFGYCSIHGCIHSFRLERIQAIRVTDIPYTPRWPVEL